MTAKVPSIDNGTTMAGMTVARALCKKRKITATTSNTVKARVN